MNFDALQVAVGTGTDPFRASDKNLDFDLLSFWQWAFSDLCSNALRGVLAEFLVARAVGTLEGVRNEWDAYDVVTPRGIKVEVKSAAYLQTWKQKRFSTISFDIAPKQGGDAAQETVAGPPTRFADVYVFALLAHHRPLGREPRGRSWCYQPPCWMRSARRKKGSRCRHF